MIRRLSEDVRGRLRTGVALTSVAQCVEELVLNSVDAGATCVAVRLDLQSLTVQVVDNGQGISREQLPLVGERYSTSKCHSAEDLDNLQHFGYRGEALASLCSASSFVEIITRPPGSAATYSKCFHKGRPLSVTEPNKPRPGVGTTVTARNLFYNLPVRKKSLNEGLELEKTRFRLAGLALMWPLISFSLRDDITGNVILQTHKCSSILGTFASLFGSARTKHMREVESSNDVFKISGYVSRENYSRKDLQFVFVNRRLVLKSKVHKMVNSVLSKSVLVRRRYTAGEKTRQVEQERSYGENGSPTKLFERYAVYVINIDCSVNVYDITFDPAKTLVEFHEWPELTSLVEAMLMKFLKEENLMLPSEESDERNDPCGVTVEPAVIVSQTSELCETEDPFDGNDEHVDEEFHDTLQRQKYAQGISVHSNINSLFSRTVRRPAAPPEKKRTDDLCPSIPKQRKLDNDTHDKNKSAKSKGHSAYNFLDMDHRKSRVVSEPAHRDCHPGTQSEDSVEEVEDINTQGQCQTSNKKQNAKIILSDYDDMDTEEYENEQKEIILPQAVGPLKRGKHHSSHKQTLTEKPQAQILSSFSECAVQDICLPLEFAHSSSLSCLRARAAGQCQPSSSGSSASTGKTWAVSSKSSAVLQTFYKAGKPKRKDYRGVEEKVDLGDDMGSTPPQIALPSVLRPPLFRSRSLDAECSYCGAKDASAQHRCPRFSPLRGVRKIQTYDDISVNYSGSSPLSVLTKRGLEHAMLMDIEQSNMSGKSHLYMSDPEEKRPLYLPSRFQVSSIFHQKQCDKRKETEVRDVQSVPHDDSRQITNKARTFVSFTHETTQVHNSMVPEHARSGLKRDSSSASRRAMNYTTQHSKAPRTEQTVCETHRPLASSRTEATTCQTLESHRQTSGQSHTSHTRSGQQRAVSFAAKLSAAAHSSTRSDFSQCSSKPGRPSQASRLAQLMRREHAPNPEHGTTRHEQAGRYENFALQQGDCSLSYKGEKITKSCATTSSTVGYNSAQDFRKGHCQATHVQTERRPHQLTALEMLSSCRPSHRSLEHKKHVFDDTEKQSSVRFPQLRLFETPRTVFERCSNAGDVSSQNPSEQRHTLETDPTLRLFQTPHRVFSARDSVAVHGEETTTHQSQRGQTSTCSVNTNDRFQKRIRSRNISFHHPVSFCHPPSSNCCSSGCAACGSSEDQDTIAMKRKGQINTSDDTTYAGFCHETDASAFQNVMTIPISQAIFSKTGPVSHTDSSQTGNVSVEYGRSRREPDSCQQHTQGFSAVSSQGFVSQLTETGTLPFDMNASEGSMSQSKVQSDSPVSNHSAGFSPSTHDPLLGNLKSQNRINDSTIIEGTQTSLSGSVSSISCEISQTQAVAETDSVANSCPNQSKMHLIGSSLDLPFSCSRSTAQSPEFCERKIDSDSLENGDGSNQTVDRRSHQTKHHVQLLHRLSVFSEDSQQVMQHSQKRRTFPYTGQNWSLSNAENLSSAIAHQLPARNTQSSDLETYCEDSQVVSSKISHTGTASPSTSNITSDLTSSHVDISTARNSVHPSGTVLQVSDSESSVIVSSVTISSYPASGDVNASFHSLPDSVEGLIEDQCSTESKTIRKQGTPGQKEQNSEMEQTDDEHKENSQVLENLNIVCEHPCHNQRENTCQNISVCSSEKQPVTLDLPCEGLSTSSKRDMKQKEATDQTYNFSSSTRKQTRPLDITESAHTSAEQVGVFSVNIPSHSAKPVSSGMSTDARILSDASYKKIGSTSCSQQTDSFSDSVPDSALASIAMPASQSPASLRDMSSTDSLPDSVIACIAFPEKITLVESATKTCISPSMADSGTDAILASISLQETQDEPRKENVMGDSLTDVSTERYNTEISQELSPPQIKTNICVTQNAYNLGLSTSMTCSINPSAEGFSFADPASSGVCPTTSAGNNSADMNMEDINKSHPVSQGILSETVDKDIVMKDGAADKGRDEQYSRDRNDVLSNCTAIKESWGREEEKQVGPRIEDDSPEVAWLPVTDLTTGGVITIGVLHICHTTSGKLVFMNSGSGHTLNLAQWNKRELAHRQTVTPQKQGQTTVTKPPSLQAMAVEELTPVNHDSLEALVSSHLEEEEMKAHSKWREGSRMPTEAAVRGETVKDMMTSWENPVFKKPEQVLQTSSRSQAGRVARCFFQPTVFIKAMLSGAKVIGQLDNKFLACLIQEDEKLLPSTSSDMQDSHGGGLVVLFDQHAAHERIRLEQLLADVYEKEDGASGTEKKRIKRCNVQPPRTMDLSEEDVRLMQTFREEFDRIGVKFEVDEERRDRVHAHTIPACMAQREANDSKRGKDPLSYKYLQIMIKEHNQLLLSTAGARHQLPQQVHRLLATHACKGAIKFGDKLSTSTCREMLSSLSSCDLPFQCAHGRPSIAPVLSLTQLRQAAPETKRLPRLWKLRTQCGTTAQNQ